VVTDDARLMAIARGTGKIRWVTQLRGYTNPKNKKNAITWVGPVLAGNKLWLVNSRKELVSVAPADGTVGTTVELDGEVSLGPVVANETLYVLTDKGRITAYR
jgi:outer membrane protein assembly factor BamB